MKSQTECDHNRRKEQEFANANDEIAYSRKKIVANMFKLAYHQKSIQSRVHQQKLGQGRESGMGKAAVNPVEFDRNSHNREYDHVLPAQSRYGCWCAVGWQEFQQRAYTHWNEKEDEKKCPTKFTA